MTDLGDSLTRGNHSRHRGYVNYPGTLWPNAFVKWGVAFEGEGGSFDFGVLNSKLCKTFSAYDPCPFFRLDGAVFSHCRDGGGPR